MLHCNEIIVIYDDDHWHTALVEYISFGFVRFFSLSAQLYRTLFIYADILAALSAPSSFIYIIQPPRYASAIKLNLSFLNVVIGVDWFINENWLVCSNNTKWMVLGYDATYMMERKVYFLYKS